jgi:hypothetical protein
VRYPHAQNRDRDMQGRDWVKDARSRFAAVTNGVMERSGKGVRYDPGSYKDMGLEASPMKNVNRIVSDKARAGSFVVMDADWTRRMVEEEIRDAAIRRDSTFKALVRTEQMLAESARSAAAAQRVQAKMPAHLRMGHSMSIGTAIARRITTAVLENERERLSQRFVDEATERTLRHVVEATSPKKGVGAERRRRGAGGRGPLGVGDPVAMEPKGHFSSRRRRLRDRAVALVRSLGHSLPGARRPTPAGSGRQHPRRPPASRGAARPGAHRFDRQLRLGRHRNGIKLPPIERYSPYVHAPSRLACSFGQIVRRPLQAQPHARSDWADLRYTAKSRCCRRCSHRSRQPGLACSFGQTVLRTEALRRTWTSRKTAKVPPKAAGGLW